MLHGNMRVHFMDVKSERFDKISIEDVFQRYSHLAKFETPDNSSAEISFVDAKYKTLISDWTGWTSVTSIKKIVGSFDIYNVEVHPENISRSPTLLQCTGDTLIPTYRRLYVPGFHGERKYPFTVKQLNEINISNGIPDLVRFYHQDVDRDDDLLYEINSKEFYIKTLTVYEIITNSGFFNVDSYYLWGKTYIPGNYCEICPLHETQNCVECRR